jgi:hypothetical protein
MKRLISIICILFLTFSSVSAEISEGDLNQLKQAFDQASYDELMVLYNFLTSYIMSRSEWKEVEVPAGTWIVGEDIPSGTYSVSALDYPVMFKFYEAGSEYYDYYMIRHEDCIGKITLTDGMKIETNYRCVFAPPKGLGF